MACGQAAKEMYKLLDDLGGETSIRILFESLIRWMSADEIEEFIENFRRVHGIISIEECED